MATHSSVLAWKIPGTEGPSGLPSMGLHRVGYDWSDLAAAACWVYIYIYIYILQLYISSCWISLLLCNIPCLLLELYFKIYFVWCELCYSQLSFHCHLHGISLSSPQFQSLYFWLEHWYLKWSLIDTYLLQIYYLFSVLLHLLSSFVVWWFSFLYIYFFFFLIEE